MAYIMVVWDGRELDFHCQNMVIVIIMQYHIDLMFTAKGAQVSRMQSVSLRVDTQTLHCQRFEQAASIRAITQTRIVLLGVCRCSLCKQRVEIDVLQACG